MLVRPTFFPGISLVAGTGSYSTENAGTSHLLAAHISQSGVREKAPFGADTFGRPVNKPASYLEDLSRTAETFVSRGTQKVGFHLTSDGRIAYAELRLDGEPHCDIGGSHEYEAADNPARPFEYFPKRHIDAALAIIDGSQGESKVTEEIRLTEDALQFLAGTGKIHSAQFNPS